jgi:hypothetical protein
MAIVVSCQLPETDGRIRIFEALVSGRRLHAALGNVSGADYINQLKRRNPWMNRTHIDKIMQWQQ